MGFLLDTSAINRICDGKACADDWSPFYITDLVLFELGRTEDTVRRYGLFGALQTNLGVLRSKPSAFQDTEGQWGYGQPTMHHCHFRSVDPTRSSCVPLVLAITNTGGTHSLSSPRG